MVLCFIQFYCFFSCSRSDPALRRRAVLTCGIVLQLLKQVYRTSLFVMSKQPKLSKFFAVRAGEIGVDNATAGNGSQSSVDEEEEVQPLVIFNLIHTLRESYDTMIYNLLVFLACCHFQHFWYTSLFLPSVNLLCNRLGMNVKRLTSIALSPYSA